jgi:hypothetical protein
MQCPFCQSNQIQRYPVVYRDGTHQFHTVHVGEVRGQSIGSMQSHLAAQCAPPKPPNPLFALVPLGFGGYLMYLSLNQPGSFVWKDLLQASGVLGLGLVMWSIYRASAKAYMQEKLHWQSSWMCLACGNGHVR